MKKKLLSTLFGILFGFFLSGCPSEKEIKEITNETTERKVSALIIINNNDYNLDGLLKVQDYFFDFTEKVHLIKEDDRALEKIKKMIQKDGVKTFCEKFIIPVRIWTNLENHCHSSEPYKCSLDIKTYPNTQNTFLELIGDALSSQFQKESSCN